jgi:hypothetical protein
MLAEKLVTLRGLRVTPEHWKRLTELFQAAVEQDPSPTSCAACLPEARR